MTTINVTVDLIKFRRSYTPGYRPAMLREGEPFVNVPDGLVLIGQVDEFNPLEFWALNALPFTQPATPLKPWWNGRPETGYFLCLTPE